jgi:hypothetical protein
MRNHKAAVSALILGFLATAPAFADSVAVSSGPNGKDGALSSGIKPGAAPRRPVFLTS